MDPETPTFSRATSVTPQTSHTYTANFPSGWCIGSVPHGGFVTSCFMNVASQHFATTHAAQNQPHTIALHLHFLRRTEVGPALFTVTDVKLGRQTSTLHVSLSQDVGGSGEPRVEVQGYITRSNISAEDGPSFTTDWALSPAPPPGVPSSFELHDGVLVDPDGVWAERKELPFSNFRKATRPIRFLFPAKGHVARATTDQWMGLRSGENWTNEGLGFVCDMFPQIIETLVAQDEKGTGAQAPSVARFWFPTVLLNLEVKKALPERGVPWLFLRCRAKVIKNGRYDLEVVILDEEGDVVGLSHHVCLVADAKRNLKKRNGRGEEKQKDSKI